MDLKIGTHCGIHSCNQLDFLPFTCDRCNKKFCNSHKDYAAHECTAIAQASERTGEVPMCPVCSQPVPIKPGEDVNMIVMRHIEGGCVTRKLVADGAKCKAPNCNVKHNHTPIKCLHCKDSFCVKHRCPEDHQCPKYKPPTAQLPKGKPSQAATSSSGIASTVVRAATAMFSRTPAAAAQSSSAAVGPSTQAKEEDDRVYFTILMPTTGLKRPAQKPQRVFGHRRWSVGKMLDWVCEYWGLPQSNTNQRFRMVTMTSLEVVPNNMCLHESRRVGNDGIAFPDLTEGVCIVPENLLQRATGSHSASSLSTLMQSGRSGEDLLALLYSAPAESPTPVAVH